MLLHDATALSRSRRCPSRAACVSVGAQSMRIIGGSAFVGISMIALGCAGSLRVVPTLPSSAAHSPPARASVSLYIDPEIERLRSQVTTPSGDIGLGDITVEFDLGAALAGTIRGAARQTFATVHDVSGPACADGTAAVLAASLPAPPHMQIHWRGQTPRVGGGTIAEISVRITPQRCDGGAPLQSALARGTGRAERMQIVGNWPSEDDFQPGIDQALDDLQVNLVTLFADMAKSLAAP